MSAARCPVNFRCFASLALEKRSNRQQVSDRVLILQWFTAFRQQRILNGVYPTIWATCQSNSKLKFGIARANECSKMSCKFQAFCIISLEKTSNRQQVSDWFLILQWLYCVS